MESGSVGGLEDETHHLKEFVRNGATYAYAGKDCAGNQQRPRAEAIIDEIPAKAPSEHSPAKQAKARSKGNLGAFIFVRLDGSQDPSRTFVQFGREGPAPRPADSSPPRKKHPPACFVWLFPAPPVTSRRLGGATFREKMSPRKPTPPRGKSGMKRQVRRSPHPWRIPTLWRIAFSMPSRSSR